MLFRFLLLSSISASALLGVKLTSADGTIHYLPDAAAKLNEAEYSMIPHLKESNNIVYAYDKSGVKLSIKTDASIDSAVMKNFKNIFTMQTNGNKNVDKIITVKPMPNSDLLFIVYILNGSLYASYCTKDGTAMIRYSPFTTGNISDLYAYTYIIADASAMKQINTALHSESRFARMALALKDSKYIYEIKKGKLVPGSYFFADPMCSACIKEIAQMKKDVNVNKTIILLPMIRSNGLNSILRSAYIIQEIEENNITDSNKIIDVMSKYFGEEKTYNTGSVPEQKYIMIVKNLIKKYLPITGNKMPYAISYKSIEPLVNGLAYVHKDDK